MPGKVLEPFLNIGVIVAFFRQEGNMPLCRQSFMRVDKVGDTDALINFRTFVGMLPGPTALLLSR